MQHLQQLRREDPGMVRTAHGAAFTITRRVSDGDGATVYLGWTAQDRPLAVKIPSGVPGRDMAAEIARERDALTAVAGRYLARFVDCAETASPSSPFLWLATEFVAAPTLDFVLKRPGALSTGTERAEAVRRLAFGLATALARIHKAKLVHGDVSPMNILLAGDGPVLLDLGLADPRGTVRFATRDYTSPENLDERRRTPKGDMYALGAVLVAAATGRPPSVPDAQIWLPDQLPAKLRTRIQECLSPNPAARPKARQLVKAARAASATPREAGWWPAPVRGLIGDFERECDQAKDRARYVGGGTRYQDLATLPQPPGSGPAHSGAGAIPPRRPGAAKPGKAGRSHKRAWAVSGVAVLAVVGLVAAALFLHDKPKSKPHPVVAPKPTVLAPPYRWSVVSSPTLTESESGENIEVLPGTPLAACTVVKVSVTLQNTGSHSWASTGPDAVDLAANDPADSGCASSNASGVLQLSGTAVPPGQNATFNGTVLVPKSGDLNIQDYFEVGGVSQGPDGGGTLVTPGQNAPAATASGASAVPVPTMAVITLHQAAVPIVAVAAAGADTYWLATSFGDVVSSDGKRTLAPADGSPRPRNVVGIACPDAAGCWLVTGGGTIVPYGDAPAIGPVSGYPAPTKDVVGIAAEPGGFLLAVDNGPAVAPTIVPYGQAVDHAIEIQLPMNADIVGIAGAPGGAGYWLLGADGGVFSSDGVKDYNSPDSSSQSGSGDPRNVDGEDNFVAIAATADGKGYTIVTSDGYVLTYGDAGEGWSLEGTMPSDGEIVGFAYGKQGYLLADNYGPLS